MMTLFLLAMLGTALILGSLPVVLYALMLESVRARRPSLETSGVRTIPVRRRAFALARAA